MTAFICKACGRAIETETRPNFCYADRMDTMENLSAEDAQRMGLFSAGGFYTQEGMKFEFPKDVNFHPFTGQRLCVSPYGKASLSELQASIMGKVRDGLLS